MLTRMTGSAFRTVSVFTATCLMMALIVSAQSATAQTEDDEYTQDFHLERCTWTSSGANLFFALIPGVQQVLQGEEDGEAVEITMTVLDETEEIDGAATGVIEDRETVDGELIEVTHDYYSFCEEYGSVFYFGEDVDKYENGEIVSHEGSWRAGIDGAEPGLYMPGQPLLGERYYQEIAEDVAMDRAETVSLTDEISVPYGEFDGCLRTRETTPLEPDAEEFKVYCPGVGLVRDDVVDLVSLEVPDGVNLPQASTPADLVNDEYTDTFHLDACTWEPNGRNLYFSLIPGTQLVIEGEENGQTIRTTITVLDETRDVAGVPTRVIEERHLADGMLDEVSRNFYSMCSETSSVFYFGEEVDFYESGQIVSHEGAWQAGEDGAMPGLYMPGLALLGARYYQEIAPDIAMDRAEIVSLDASADVPAGMFDRCIATIESSPLDPDAEDDKIYCADVGITNDTGQLLVEIGMPDGSGIQPTWARTDQPVATGMTMRTWMWGPAPFTAPMLEDYADSPNGQRMVQYFDKSRMEVTHPDSDQASPWHITNGLLVVEMVEGRFQTGDSQFDESPDPADVNIAGDPGQHPTYADVGALGLMGSEPQPVGSVITASFADGQIVDDQRFAAYGATVAIHVADTGHSVASVFYEYLNSSGLVYSDGDYIEGRLFDPWFYASGYPITEAYWSTIMVNGSEQDVLWQCFERRCLTWTSSNPEGWQVEAGNVGRHYYEWRYQ